MNKGISGWLVVYFGVFALCGALMIVLPTMNISILGLDFTAMDLGDVNLFQMAILIIGIGFFARGLRND